MGADSFAAVERAADWLQLSIPDSAQNRLTRYAEWLTTEAIAAGGIGPNEAGRIWSRHIADSITFGIKPEPGAVVLDIGSGVGLPGLPLAMVHREARFDLVDRSGRRCDLLNRAITVLALDNCEVIHRDIANVDKRYDHVVSRASLPPSQLMIHVKRTLGTSGTAVIALSRTEQELPELDLPSGWRASVASVPVDILDTPAYLLRIVAA